MRPHRSIARLVKPIAYIPLAEHDEAYDRRKEVPAGPEALAQGALRRTRSGSRSEVPQSPESPGPTHGALYPTDLSIRQNRGSLRHAERVGVAIQRG